MSLLPNDDDWMCFTDLDTCFLDPKDPEKIEYFIDKYPDTGIFTCYTNRVGNKYQLLNGIKSEDSDILNHIKIAKSISGDCKEIKSIISGMCMIVKKSTWSKVGGFQNGLLGVDNKFSHIVLRYGMKIRLIESVYLFHVYRLDTNSKSHLL